MNYLTALLNPQPPSFVGVSRIHDTTDPDEPQGTRVCKCCGAERDITEYRARHIGKRIRIDTVCKTCQNNSLRARRHGYKPCPCCKLPRPPSSFVTKGKTYRACGACRYKMTGEEV